MYRFHIEKTGFYFALRLPCINFANDFSVSYMSCVLHIETSTNVCSVALSQDGVYLTDKESREGPSHATLLAPFVDEVLSYADSHAIPLDAVAVSCGPGSYTGLRIGVSTAKGLCYGRNLPLLSVPTLKLLCVPVLLYGEELPDDALLCPMIDARRMEVYATVCDRSLKELRPTSADIVAQDSYLEYLESHPMYFFGNGAEKCRDIIRHPNAHFIGDIYPSARHMFPLAEQALARRHYEDVAYFEPFYLKDFVAGSSKKIEACLHPSSNRQQ